MAIGSCGAEGSLESKQAELEHEVLKVEAGEIRGLGNRMEGSRKEDLQPSAVPTEPRGTLSTARPVRTGQAPLERLPPARPGCASPNLFRSQVDDEDVIMSGGPKVGAHVGHRHDG